MSGSFKAGDMVRFLASSHPGDYQKGRLVRKVAGSNAWKIDVIPEPGKLTVVYVRYKSEAELTKLGE